jgi:hypothetical protein
MRAKKRISAHPAYPRKESTKFSASPRIKLHHKIPKRFPIPAMAMRQKDFMVKGAPTRGKIEWRVMKMAPMAPTRAIERLKIKR